MVCVDCESDGLVAEGDKAEGRAVDRHLADFPSGLDAMFFRRMQGEFVDLWGMGALANEDDCPGLGIDTDCFAIAWAVFVTELDLPSGNNGGSEIFSGFGDGGFPEYIKCAGVAPGGVVTGIGDEQVVFSAEGERGEIFPVDVGGVFHRHFTAIGATGVSEVDVRCAAAVVDEPHEAGIYGGNRKSTGLDDG